MKYNTVIFDMDGTLLNTLEDLHDSLNAMLRKNGYSEKSLDEVRRFIGNGVGVLIKLALPKACTEEDFNRCAADFKETYKKNMQNKTRPFDGIRELLLELKQNNYKVAIVSNKFDPAVKALTKDYFGNLIPVAIGESAAVKRKPAPDCVLMAVKELGSDIRHTIYVGDSETDVRTAQNAGIPCVGVTWGYRGRKVLIEAGADYLIDTPGELMSIL